MNNKKNRLFSLLLSFMMLVTMMPIMSQNVFATEETKDYVSVITYSDIQSCQETWKENLTIGKSSMPIINIAAPQYSQVINEIYLAKHETEGFQVSFYEEKDGGRDITINVESFKNENGEELEHKMYSERDLLFEKKHFSDILIPYEEGTVITTEKDKNNMIYVEVKSKTNQTPGKYTSKITICEGDTVLEEKIFTANVWNFALPEAHYGTTFMGLYNSSSGYSATRGFLELGGVEFDASGEPKDEENKEKAEKILEGWDEFLLEHGVNSYELPRYMIDNDTKKTELAMADTRRSAFDVPILNSVNSGSLTQTSKDKINQYKSVVKDNKFIKDKALFYTKDEPNWANENDVKGYESLCNEIETLWPGFHSVVPFCSVDSYDFKIGELRKTSDIFCPNQDTIRNNPTVLNDFIDGTWHRTWRYQGDTSAGGTYLHRWDHTAMGVFARIQYWQQDSLNSNGILHWNCGYVPYQNGKPIDMVQTQTMLEKRIGPGGVNGDGILVYSGASLGLDPTTPLASLRLKHVSNGMDDFDYLQLAKEFLGEDSDAYQVAVNKVLQNKKQWGLQNIFYCEKGYGGHVYDWNGSFARFMNDARIILGNALSEANTEHDYGDYELAVGCDENHEGLKIRTCQDCGAQESMKVSMCNDNHQFESEKVIIPATCTKEGQKSRECKVCGYIDTQSIPARHQNTKEVQGKSVTCTEAGYTAGIYCEDCKQYISGHTEIPARHQNTKEVQGKSATCTEAGYTTGIYCEDCKQYISGHENIEPTGHKHIVIDQAVPATYTKEGKTRGSHCSDCDTVLIEQHIVKKNVLMAPVIRSVKNVINGVRISWGKIAVATGYEVYRGKKLLKTVKGTNYIDKKAVNGAVNNYKIVAIRKEGRKTATSKPSAVKSVLWIASPQCFTAKNIKGKKIAVSWKKNRKTSGYQIQYGIKGKKLKTLTIKSAQNVKNTISKLVKGKQYTVKIRAYKKVSGKTYYSAWQSKTVKVKQ